MWDGWAEKKQWQGYAEQRGRIRHVVDNKSVLPVVLHCVLQGAADKRCEHHSSFLKVRAVKSHLLARVDDKVFQYLVQNLFLAACSAPCLIGMAFGTIFCWHITCNGAQLMCLVQKGYFRM